MKISSLISCLGFTALCACSASKSPSGISNDLVQVSIDLESVDADRVRVKVVPPRQQSGPVSYHFPKIIPGTYAIADYGRYVDDIKAFKKNGSEIKVSRTDSNTVVIDNAKQLAYLSYLVNDTFDNEESSDPFSEKSKTIFSPAGTNIDAGKHFLLNMAGFVGYFTDQLERPYRITINHPESLYGTTAMVDSDNAPKTDVFDLTRYPEVVDHPVMYAPADTAGFRVNDMQVALGVYSRRGHTHASDLRPDLEKMVRAQKRFLGPLNDTRKYAVLAYISSGAADDAKGIGALEHNTSTSAVFHEPMKNKDLIHVISHEFFHTITPLKVHSKEIHYFDFNNPEMSRHLWFYEGITEYFSNLFQVNQGLITDDAFYDLMSRKIENSHNYNDKLSFTEMSRHVLDPKMKAQYPNVYEKGALIAMCLDIVIREQTQGKQGLLWLMGELSKKYGADKPFDDAELIPTITQIAGSEAGKFLETYVVNGEQIPYADFLAKTGLTKTVVPLPEPIVFVSQDVAYIKTDSTNTRVLASLPDDANLFYKNLGIKDNDIFLEFNGIPVDPNDLNSIVYLGYDLDEGGPITVKVNREGKDIELKGTVKLNYADTDSFRFADPDKKGLNEAWLKQ